MVQKALKGFVNLALASAAFVGVSEAGEPAACYRVEERGVFYHKEGFDPQFKRTHVVRRPMPEADPGSFSPIAGPHFSCVARDSKFVYWHERIIAGADPASFRYTHGGYALDARSVFYLGGRLDGAHRESFTAFEFRSGLEPYIDAKDSARLYSKGAPPAGKLAAGLDIESFIALSRYFYKDKSAVYRVTWGKKWDDHGLQTVAGANPEDFRIYWESFGLAGGDGKRVYMNILQGRRYVEFTPEDAGSFVFLDKDYARDTKRVYYRGEPLEGVEAEGFSLKAVKEGARKMKRK